MGKKKCGKVKYREKERWEKERYWDEKKRENK